MSMQEKSEGGLTLVDAVEALNAIVEGSWDDERMVDGDDEEAPMKLRTIAWLRGEDKERALEVVKDIFKVILRHFRNFYQNEYTLVTDSKTLEGIKGIMLLVGEAAKKIDRLSDIIKEAHAKSITDIKEYKQLQDFYRRKISRTIDEALIGKWILALTKRTFQEHERTHPQGIKSLETKHIFVDLDSVKKDTEYELFFIRKEDGTRFFNPKLIRNIKLVCDFGTYLGMEKDRDPLVDHAIWEDRFSNIEASTILSNVLPTLNRFYKQVVHHKEDEFYATLNKAIIALMQAANKNCLVSSGSTKTCSEYFLDFQLYLREVLFNRDYQKLIAFETMHISSAKGAAKSIIDALLSAIFSKCSPILELGSYMHYLIDEGNELLSSEHRTAAIKSGKLWNHLACDYAALQKILRHHPNGPLDKVLELLEDGDYQVFDPYLQGKVPELRFKLQEKNKQIAVYTLPSPTTQEFIHQVKLHEEFLEFIRGEIPNKSSLLVINLQDRTSWREHARSCAIEELQEVDEFKNTLSVVTLPKDTEFYNQEAPYLEDHQTVLFKKHFREHILDDHSGYYFPAKLKPHSSSIDGLFDGIHKVFFSGKNVLSREARMNFIEIFYLFCELKLIEMTGAQKVYFSCKDGLDASTAASGALFAFLKVINEEKVTPLDIEELELMIHAPSLIERERVMLPDRFKRLVDMLNVVEQVISELGHKKFQKLFNDTFSKFYQTEIFASHSILPHRIG